MTANVDRVISEHRKAQAAQDAQFQARRETLDNQMARLNEQMAFLAQEANIAATKLAEDFDAAFRQARDADRAEEDKAREERDKALPTAARRSTTTARVAVGGTA
jgi:peptidoglycan hydrolase CwlO-like protein